MVSNNFYIDVNSHHAINKLEIHQLYLKTTFLNGLRGKIQWFIVKGNENKICKFVKSSYDLTQDSK
jgi:hypothetical protein